MFDRNKRAMLGLVVICFFILLVFYIPTFLKNKMPALCFEDGLCQHEAYLESILTYIPALIVLGFLLGIIVSFFYFERKLEIPLPSEERKAAYLSLLQPSERKVLEKVIGSGGKVLQSEVSRVEGVGKVKAHRVIERLIKRGVLEKEQMGKTNMLRLRKDLMDALSKES